jgi:hypothetical protein
MQPFPPLPQPQRHLRNMVLVALVACGCSLLLAATASATDFTWSGGGVPGSDDWSTSANWLGGVAPAPGSSIGNLTFPLRPSQTDADNDVSGLSVNQLEVDDSHYDIISGQGLTLGGGGLAVSAAEGSTGSLDVANPITLGASQTWNVSGPPVPSESFSFSQGLTFHSALTGESSDLTLNLNTHALFVLGTQALNEPTVDDELGTVTINGTETKIGESTYKSFVVLASANLNANDGHSLILHDLDLQSDSATGPITATDSSLLLTGSASGPLTVSGSRLEPSEKLTLASASLDAGSTLALGVESNPQPPSGVYDRLHSTGAVALGGSSLELGTAPTESGECRPPAVGQVQTLVSTTGSLTGSFGNAPNGSVVTADCFSLNQHLEVAASRWYSFRIDYHTGSSPETVTATTLPAVPTP